MNRPGAYCTAAALGLYMGLASTSLAEAPSQSIRPEVRPESRVEVEVKAEGDEQPTVTATIIRPVPRPVVRVPVAKVAPVVVAVAAVETPTPPVNPSANPEAVAISPRPDKRPKNIGAIVRAALQRPKAEKPVVYAKRGSVCGDKSIRGQRVSAIPGRIKGCGIANPVKITEVDGVKLSMAATVNCDTAKALKAWVSQSVKPAVGRMGGGVNGLRVAAHYSCRTRNNIPGAKISEHGRGNAIDISAIRLKNGTMMTVLSGWRNKTEGPVLRKMHKGACGKFGTVLGPESDRYHQDHFHFDVASHRSGAYCR